MSMKFYDCATAPSPRRVRMYIAEKGLDIPVVEVDLANREQHSDAFQKINPSRTVPVLQLDDGRTLITSAGIQCYLEGLHPEPPLFGRDGYERALIVDLDWKIENEGFLAVGEAFRNRAKSFANNALTGKHEYSQIPALVERGSNRTIEFFNWLDQQLQDKEVVAGDVFTVADITAFITVDFAKWVKLQPDPELKNLRRWLESVANRPSAKV